MYFVVNSGKERRKARKVALQNLSDRAVFAFDQVLRSAGEVVEFGLFANSQEAVQRGVDFAEMDRAVRDVATQPDRSHR